MQNIDSKIIVTITLILGLLVGFYVNNSLISKPRIETLTQTTTEQTTTITRGRKHINTTRKPNRKPSKLC